MGAPIVVQPRQNPWNNLLPQLFMMKIKHNMDMEVMDAETKRRSAQQKAQQSYTEGRTKEAGINKAKMEGYEEVPYSARMQMEKSGTAPSDVVGVFGTQLRRPQDEVYTDPKFPGMILKKSPTGTITMQNSQKDSESDQGMNKISDYATFYRGFKTEHPELTGGNLDSAVSKAWSARKEAEGAARGAGFAKSRATAVIDTFSGNRPVTMSVWDVIKANQETPGRFLTTGPSEKALNRTALIEDIRGTISNVRTSLEGMDDFTTAQRAQISLVMKQRDPTSAASKFLGGTWGTTLSPVQQDYIIDLAQLIENGMAMRSVLGAGQGSDDLREAIKATIPGPSTPNKQYALKQLVKFNQVLNRLERGVLKVPLRAKESNRDYGAPTSSDQPTQQAKPQQAQGPKPGTIDGGYIFKGGDPSDPKNWTKVN